MNYRFNDPKSHEEGKAPYEDIVAAVQKGLLSRDVIVTGPHGSTTPFAEPTEVATTTADTPLLPAFTPHSEEETVYFQDPFVTITAARVVVGMSTFPIRQVASIKVNVSPANYIFSGVLLFLAVVLGLATLFGPQEARWVMIYSAALMACLGIFAAITAKSSYRIKVGNTGGEFLGTTSHSKSYITKVHTALSESIVNFR